MKNDEETEAECLYHTSPDDMEDYVSDRNDENNEKNYKEKEAECINVTFHDEMEEGVNDRNENKNVNYDEEKIKVKQQILIATKLMKVKE